MLLAGLAGVALALAASPAFNWAYTTYAADQMPGWMIPELVDMGLNIVRYLIAALMLFMGGASAVLSLLGIGMLILSRQKSHQEQPEELTPQHSLVLHE